MSRPGCVFCAIVAGQAPSHRVYEDAAVLGFMDVMPVGDGHLLVVTKPHYVTLLEADEPSLLAVMRASRRLAHALQRVFSPDGIAVHQFNGAAAGQSVFHYHMHLVPRRHGDPVGFHGRTRADAARLAEHARKLEAALRETAPLGTS